MNICASTYSSNMIIKVEKLVEYDMTPKSFTFIDCGKQNFLNDIFIQGIKYKFSVFTTSEAWQKNIMTHYVILRHILMNVTMERTAL